MGDAPSPEVAAVEVGNYLRNAQITQYPPWMPKHSVVRHPTNHTVSLLPSGWLLAITLVVMAPAVVATAFRARVLRLLQLALANPAPLAALGALGAAPALAAPCGCLGLGWRCSRLRWHRKCDICGNRGGWSITLLALAVLRAATQIDGGALARALPRISGFLDDSFIAIATVELALTARTQKGGSF